MYTWWRYFENTHEPVNVRTGPFLSLCFRLKFHPRWGLLWGQKPRHRNPNIRTVTCESSSQNLRTDLQTRTKNSLQSVYGCQQYKSTTRIILQTYCKYIILFFIILQYRLYKEIILLYTVTLRTFGAICRRQKTAGQRTEDREVFVRR
jgi:hypothetical protein